MKQIVKNQEPRQFSIWKMSDKMAHRPNWNRVDRANKKVIHDALMNEQGHICCYCESPVTRDNSHVEHLRPRSTYPHLQLDYSNLHCSCEASSGEPVRCGHKKGNWFDDDLMISPLEQNCGRRFRFNINGEILPRSLTDSAAKETIKRLGLDLPKLNARRAAAMDELRGLPLKDIKALLVRGPDGFLAYFTTIEDVLL